MSQTWRLLYVQWVWIIILMNDDDELVVNMSVIFYILDISLEAPWNNNYKVVALTVSLGKTTLSLLSSGTKESTMLLWMTARLHSDEVLSTCATQNGSEPVQLETVEFGPTENWATFCLHLENLKSSLKTLPTVTVKFENDVKFHLSFKQIVYVC